jgi:flagellar basal body-associated protein FliL
MSSRDVIAGFNNLSQSAKDEARRQIAGLPIPSRNFLGAVWIILMITLALVVLGGGWLVFLLVDNGKDSEVTVGFVSAALGALIGLLAPSPAART